MKQLLKLNQLAFYLLISLFLTACGEQEKVVAEPVKEVLTLSNKNIKGFTKDFAKEYFSTLNSLVTSFKAAKKNDNKYDFINYRNRVWTPNYKERKDYYEAILEKNNTFIKNAGITPLFEEFSGIIYIGIYLKNGLMDDDNEKLKKASSLMKEGTKVVKNLSK